MDPLTAFLILLGAAALLMAVPGTRAGARLALLVATSLLPLPALVMAHPVTIAMLAVAALALVFTAVDFAYVDRPARLKDRLVLALASLVLADARHLTRRPRQFDRRAAAQVLGAVLAAGVALLVWSHADALAWLPRYLARCAAGAVVVLAVAEVMTGLVGLISGLAGASLRPVHDSPYRARTVGEFWSRRWNPLVGAWLHRHCFRRLAPRGARLAMIGTFVASAALHAYLLLAIDLLAALSWAAFFIAQPVLVLAERKLGVRRWPAALAHTWTVTCMVLLLPLMLSPILPLFRTSL